MSKMYVLDEVNLDEFAFVKENRDIVGGKKYKTLKSSIDELRYLISPIVVMLNDGEGNLVDLDGEDLRSNGAKYIVVDGQHRLTVCRDLELEPTIVVNENVTRNDIVTANNTGNKWGLLDYVNFHKEKNEFNFIQLDAMIKSYSQKGFTTSAVIEAFHIKDGGNDEVKDGSYVIDPVTGHHILMSCLTVKSILPDVFKQVKLIRALKNIFKRYPTFDMGIVADELKKGEIEFELKHIPSKDSNMILEIYARSFDCVDTHSIPQDMREFVVAYYNGRCNYEGCSAEANHIDHIKAYSKGGETCLDNLQLLCEQCNKHKSNKDA